MIVIDSKLNRKYDIERMERDRYNLVFGDCLSGVIHSSQLHNDMYGYSTDTYTVVTSDDGTRYRMYTSAGDLCQWDAVGKLFQYSIPSDKYVQVMLVSI